MGLCPMILCSSSVIFYFSCMQRLPAMLPGTVVMSPISHVESEFQSHYNTLTLEPQDVLHFGHQIASGMVSKDSPDACWILVTGLLHLSRSSWLA